MLLISLDFFLQRISSMNLLFFQDWSWLFLKVYAHFLLIQLIAALGLCIQFLRAQLLIFSKHFQMVQKAIIIVAQ